MRGGEQQGHLPKMRVGNGKTNIATRVATRLIHHPLRLGVSPRSGVQANWVSNGNLHDPIVLHTRELGPNNLLVGLQHH